MSQSRLSLTVPTIALAVDAGIKAQIVAKMAQDPQAFGNVSVVFLDLEAPQSLQALDQQGVEAVAYSEEALRHYNEAARLKKEMVHQIVSYSVGLREAPDQPPLVLEKKAHMRDPNDKRPGHLKGHGAHISSARKRR